MSRRRRKRKVPKVKASILKHIRMVPLIASPTIASSSSFATPMTASFSSASSPSSLNSHVSQLMADAEETTNLVNLTFKRSLFSRQLMHAIGTTSKLSLTTKVDAYVKALKTTHAVSLIDLSIQETETKNTLLMCIFQLFYENIENNEETPAFSQLLSMDDELCSLIGMASFRTHVDRRNTKGQTSFNFLIDSFYTLSANCWSHKMINMLLAAGADVNHPDPSFYGRTPLLYSANLGSEHGSFQFIHLLEAGARIDAQDNRGSS